MTKYVLHGGFTRIDNELNRGFWAEVARDVPENGTVLLVFFAAEDNVSERASATIESIQAQTGGKKLNLVVAIEKDFLNQLKQANAVYLHGGSTDKLVEILRKYPDLKPLFKNKTIAGSSAGAYMLSTFYPLHHDGWQQEEGRGLGILPLRVICHYESLELPPTPESVEALKNMTPELELVLLKDCEWRVFIK